MILYSRWQALHINTRHKIAEIFGIVKRGSTEVHSNVIKHDGYVVQELEETLTLEAMQKFLSCQNDDMGFLFNLVVDKVEGRELIGLIPTDPESKPNLAEAISVLPPEEAQQFKKEYKARQTLKTSIKKVSRKKKNA